MEDEDLIRGLRNKWHDLYIKLLNDEIGTKEYSMRRKIYDRMIREIKHFDGYLNIPKLELKKKQIKFGK